MESIKVRVPKMMPGDKFDELVRQKKLEGYVFDRIESIPYGSGDLDYESYAYFHEDPNPSLLYLIELRGIMFDLREVVAVSDEGDSIHRTSETDEYTPLRCVTITFKWGCKQEIYTEDISREDFIKRWKKALEGKDRRYV